jgi:hypothetical protein
VGADVGKTVGVVVGTAVGALDGAADGAVVGTAVGPPVGRAVGDVVGVDVGTSVGELEGDNVGAVDGASDGDAVGSDVGDADGEVLGAALGAPVGNAVGRADGATERVTDGAAVGLAVGESDGHWPQVNRQKVLRVAKSAQLADTHELVGMASQHCAALVVEHRDDDWPVTLATSNARPAWWCEYKGACTNFKQHRGIEMLPAKIKRPPKNNNCAQYVQERAMQHGVTRAMHRHSQRESVCVKRIRTHRRPAGMRHDDHGTQ